MIKSSLIEKLYPVEHAELHLSARRLPTFWLWTTRMLWVVIFLIMVGLNIAAIVAQVERNQSGISGGASGLRAIANGKDWSLVVDPNGPGAGAGIETGSLLLAI